MIEFIQANGWVVDVAFVWLGVVLGFLFREFFVPGGVVKRYSGLIEPSEPWPKPGPPPKKPHNMIGEPKEYGKCRELLRLYSSDNLHGTLYRCEQTTLEGSDYCGNHE